MMSKKNYVLLNEIWKDYLKTKNDDRYNQQQKNEKYASLMTLMERQYQIPLLAGEEFSQLDNIVKWLYLELSNARDFLIY